VKQVVDRKWVSKGERKVPARGVVIANPLASGTIENMTIMAAEKKR
jgi:hypothetical protein